MYRAFKNKMKCFYYFKDKTKSRVQRSAPILKGETNLSISDDISSNGRVTKSSGSVNSPRGIVKLYEEKADKLRVFTYAELRQATNDFSRLWKIGEGGFGSVYKGSIKPVGGNGDPILVAVKKLNRDGFQGHKQWVAEVQFLGVVDHPSLVKLIGYCAMDGERGIQRLLVYEFMPNKSLEDHLFRKSHEAIPWQRRLQIMLGAAQGLAYLNFTLRIDVGKQYDNKFPSQFRQMLPRHKTQINWNDGFNQALHLLDADHMTHMHALSFNLQLSP